MQAKKSLGQHFLMHARIAERIVHVALVGEGDTVLEIGPGTGILTRALLAKAKKVVAIETDRELFGQLSETFAKEIREERLELALGDIQNFDTQALIGEYKLVANIPYYLTGETFRMFLSSTHQPSSMTLLVQKEVAERIARTKKESLLSLSVKAYGTPKYEFTVPRGAFLPAPNVDSAVLSIRDISRINFKTPEAEKRFFNALHAGFRHKRKQVGKNLAEAGFDPSGLPPKVRAEDLSLSAWLALASTSA